jgi:hypothetical protein
MFRVKFLQSLTFATEDLTFIVEQLERGAQEWEDEKNFWVVLGDNKSAAYCELRSARCAEIAKAITLAGEVNV